jgi:hypothetical protein
MSLLRKMGWEKETNISPVAKWQLNNSANVYTR